jgi:hypothetical protein
MRDSTLTQTTSAAGPCPTDEELAAYIDGGLDPAESRRVTEHLASCADCFEIYSETARFLVDSDPVPVEGAAREADPARTGGVRFWRRRQVVQWAAIAAMLVAGVGGGGYSWFLAAPSPLTTIADKVPDRAELIPSLWDGPRLRGPGDDTEPGPIREDSFRMGVHLVNLPVALRAGSVRDAQDQIAWIIQLLHKQSLTQELQDGYRGITMVLASGKSPQSLLPEADRLAGRRGDAESVRAIFDPLSLDLGQWVEAGRLAALAKDPGFFQEGANRSFLRHLIWSDKLKKSDDKLDAPTLAILEQISDVFPSGNPQPSDYAKLRSLFDKILEIHYPYT